MSFSCVRGKVECDGCMSCLKEPRTIGRCVVCKDNIQAGEDHYSIDGELVHEDCLRDWADKHKVVPG